MRHQSPTGFLLGCLRCSSLILLALCLWLGLAVWWNMATTATQPHAAVIAFDATVRDAEAEHLFLEAGHEHHAHTAATTPNLEAHLAGLSYSFGRWRHPVRDITFMEDEATPFMDVLHRVVTQKKWNYFSITDERFFVGLAFVQFNYVADVFLYLVDRTDPSTRWEYHGRNPFGLGITIAPSSIRDCSQWAASLFHLETKDLSVCYDQVDRVWRGEAILPLSSSTNSSATRPLTLVFTIQTTDALTLLFPLDSTMKRPAYVHKAAGAPAVGLLHWDGAQHSINGLAAIDWTKSMARRETRWKWASFSAPGRVTVQRVAAELEPETQKARTVVEETLVDGAMSNIGINLSSDVYDYKGHSQENAIWINGTMYPLHGVSFRVPRPDVRLTDRWTVRSLSNAKVEIVDFAFQPMGAREDHTHVTALLVSDFVQAYGLANATIEFRPLPHLVYRVQLDNVLGVMEDHVAVW